MSDTATIEVTELEPTRFEVVVREGGSSTTHRVIVPAGVGVAGVSDAEVVEESFRFLLEREPKESIMTSFDLPVISRYFPEYQQEMERRLGA